MSLDVRPSDDYRRHLSGRRNGEPLDMGQRTGRCRFFLLNAVYSGFEPALDDGRLTGRPNLCFLLNVMPSVIALSMFVVRHGKGSFLHQLLPCSWLSHGN